MKTILSLIVLAMAIAPAFADDCKKCTDAKKAASKKACCMASKTMAKMPKGCCNAPGEMAKFKVYADGKYSFYGCADMAEKGRIALMEKYLDVSAVQVVTSKVKIS